MSVAGSSQQVAMLRAALKSVWAAIGDALMSGNGIEKKYAHAVQKEVEEALGFSVVDDVPHARTTERERKVHEHYEALRALGVFK